VKKSTKIVVIVLATIFGLAIFIGANRALSRFLALEKIGDGVYVLKLIEKQKTENNDGTITIKGKVQNTSDGWLFSPKVNVHYCCYENRDISVDSVYLGYRWWPMRPNEIREFSIPKASVTVPNFPTLYFDTRWK